MIKSQRHWTDLPAIKSFLQSSAKQVAIVPFSDTRDVIKSAEVRIKETKSSHLLLNMNSSASIHNSLTWVSATYQEQYETNYQIKIPELAKWNKNHRACIQHIKIHLEHFIKNGKYMNSRKKKLIFNRICSSTRINVVIFTLFITNKVPFFFRNQKRDWNANNTCKNDAILIHYLKQRSNRSPN